MGSTRREVSSRTADARARGSRLKSSGRGLFSRESRRDRWRSVSANRASRDGLETRLGCCEIKSVYRLNFSTRFDRFFLVHTYVLRVINRSHGAESSTERKPREPAPTAVPFSSRELLRGWSARSVPSIISASRDRAGVRRVDVQKLRRILEQMRQISRLQTSTYTARQQFCKKLSTESASA